MGGEVTYKYCLSAAGLNVTAMLEKMQILCSSLRVIIELRKNYTYLYFHLCDFSIQK